MTPLAMTKRTNNFSACSGFFYIGNAAAGTDNAYHKEQHQQCKPLMVPPSRSLRASWISSAVSMSYCCRSCWMIWRLPSVITTLWTGFFSLFAIVKASCDSVYHRSPWRYFLFRFYRKTFILSLHPIRPRSLC